MNSDSVAAALFEEHQPLAHHVARRFKGIAKVVGLEPQDVEQVALMGLWHACRRFDASRGFRFSTYGSRCIDGYCKTLFNRYRGGSEDRTLDEPLGIGVDQLSDYDLFDIIADSRQETPADVADTRLQAAEIRKILDGMGRDGAAVVLRAEGATFREIAKVLGVSHERSRQLVDRAIERLQRMFRAPRPAAPTGPVKHRNRGWRQLAPPLVPQKPKPQPKPFRTTHRRIQDIPTGPWPNMLWRLCGCGRRFLISRARTVRMCPRCRQNVA